MLSGECNFIKTEFCLVAETTYAEPVAFSTLIFQKKKKNPTGNVSDIRSPTQRGHQLPLAF